jgi:hypothetical protein
VRHSTHSNLDALCFPCWQHWHREHLTHFSAHCRKLHHREPCQQNLAATVTSFADNIVSAHVTAVTADIQTANIDTANIKKLCEKKSDGAPVCVTGDQLAVLLAGSTDIP